MPWAQSMWEQEEITGTRCWKTRESRWPSGTPSMRPSSFTTIRRTERAVSGIDKPPRTPRVAKEVLFNEWRLEQKGETPPNKFVTDNFETNTYSYIFANNYR